jgi:hypothetical protein
VHPTLAPKKKEKPGIATWAGEMEKGVSVFHAAAVSRNGKPEHPFPFPVPIAAPAGVVRLSFFLPAHAGKTPPSHAMPARPRVVFKPSRELTRSFFLAAIATPFFFDEARTHGLNGAVFRALQVGEPLFFLSRLDEPGAFFRPFFLMRQGAAERLPPEVWV